MQQTGDQEEITFVFTRRDRCDSQKTFGEAICDPEDFESVLWTRQSCCPGRTRGVVLDNRLSFLAREGHHQSDEH